MAGGVGVNAHNAHRLAVGTVNVCQQFGQVFFEALGAAPEWRNVGVAAGRASARHPLGEAAMVAAQGAVNLVEDAVGAAVRALAFPVAVGALQHWCVAAPVQKHHALLTLGNTLRDRGQQGWRNDARLGLVVHVNPAHQRQLAGANPAWHLEQLVAPTLKGRAAVVPAFQGWGGRTQHHFGTFQAAPVNGQVSG